jgi:hypothetical protein
VAFLLLPSCGAEAGGEGLRSGGVPLAALLRREPHVGPSFFWCGPQVGGSGSFNFFSLLLLLNYFFWYRLSHWLSDNGLHYSWHRRARLTFGTVGSLTAVPRWTGSLRAPNMSPCPAHSHKTSSDLHMYSLFLEQSSEEGDGLSDPTRRRAHRAGWKVHPVELAANIKAFLPPGSNLRPRLAAQIGDAMSGGEQDITALVTALRPGSYHRSEGARALRRHLRHVIMRCMAVVLLAARRGARHEPDLGVTGSRVEEDE